MTATPFTEVCGELLAGGTAVRFRARGSSMAPAIRDGDLLTVEPVGDRELSEGEIVVYPTGIQFRAHRVRKSIPGRNELGCQGDAWFCRPEVVSVASILGVVTGLGPSATPAPARRKLAIWGAAVRGLLARLARNIGGRYRLGRAIVLEFAQASEEGRQGSTGKGSLR